jgi:alkylhydroperoxidase/carboxymuconolactone decarboxylase family protein YurZ
MVTENDKKLPGAVITVYENGNAINTINSSDGKFNFKLYSDKSYMITFTKPGYITKRISFSTRNVPQDRAKFGFTPFTIDEVDIFPEMEGTNVDQILQQPIAKIAFDPSYHNGDFNFDMAYTVSIQSLLDKILEAKKALEARYKQLISLADGEFQKKSYDEAKNNYTAALKLKPNEQYPKDQLAAIEKAMQALKEQEARDAQALAAKKALEAQYDSLINLANTVFTAKDYNKARPLYTQASNILQNRRYPKDQIALIDKIIADQKKATANVKPKVDIEYDSLIKIADAAFNAKDYTNAKNQYTTASQLKPTRQYPKQQITAINRILAPKPVVKKDTIIKKPRPVVKKDTIMKKPKPVVRKDTVAKSKPIVKKDTAKPVPPKPAIHVIVSGCDIKGMTDSCRKSLKPFLYDGVNALHIPLRVNAQEKEIAIPSFAGQRYRMIINISAMPQGTTAIIYDQDNQHKKRKALYTLGDAVRRIGYFDAVGKSAHFYVDYEIPANNGPTASGCAVILFGYETVK